MATPTQKKENNDLSLAIIKQMTTLTTSGFGLVAALAWNNVIRETVDYYIKPYISKGSGLISLLIYAVIITILAVVVTLQLTKIEQRLTDINEALKSKLAKKAPKK
jgi:uncharacterized membrane protein (DUF106 family)